MAIKNLGANCFTQKPFHSFTSDVLVVLSYGPPFFIVPYNSIRDYVSPLFISVRVKFNCADKNNKVLHMAVE